MACNSLRAALALAVLAAFLPAQTPQKNAVGTVTAVRAAERQIDVKPDSGDQITVTLTGETFLQRVAPGETDLKKAEPIGFADIHDGDRVLVTFRPGTTEPRRVVVMAASAIAKRNETERIDWSHRGVFGVVSAKNGNEITLRMRSFQGEHQAVVTVTDKTTFRRYAPDSVKFSDAKPSSLAEISAGDQLRARGEKSEDGLKVTADEIVFGTFVTKAGSVVSVDAAGNEVTIKDAATNKPVVVKLTADSQLKRLPDFGAMGQRSMGGGPPGGFGGARQGGPGARPGGQGPGGQGGPGGPGGPGMGRRPGFDMSAMFERMPSVKLEELKPGDTIVVSSTKGAKPDQITAIMVLANADFLLRMAAAQSGRNRQDTSGPGMGGMGMGGMSGMAGAGGFELPGMIP